VSLFDDIKESAEGRELSTRWYRGKVSSLGGGSMTATQHITQGKSTARPNYGMMNLFSYRPEKGDKVPFYDVFPLAIPVARKRDGFTGINFHYLTIPQRVKLLNILVESFKDGENNKLDMTIQGSECKFDVFKTGCRRYAYCCFIASRTILQG
jgi:hypothetical protein